MIPKLHATLIVLRIKRRAGEFRPLPNDLLHSVKEIALGRDLSPSPNREHSSLFNISVLGTRSTLMAHLSCDRLQFRTGRVWAKSGDQVVSDVTLDAHTGYLSFESIAFVSLCPPFPMNLQDMRSTLVVRQAELDLPVESPRAQQCRIKRIRSSDP